ncbi:MAG: tRNA (adenosine(37)-N6)-dimethylallyltransferase MiaA [SAR86 cluster bacterium]|uniref:tRNA dimethylallyltransferase n=1 Tax=SAR86 cluster bacterium TaxID=2030880 RepID=A0A2A5C8W0_9GAMM|nr:tRNA (adenosine(37)-N6)-dimethylallyltransferase MiaA [Gammaproteobacteria bacterium AH-315-E17]PCJ40193.1 MAG: tRNA (adenosine(37)-N6)-dimethylallyltransferase MiaA [SAR86 cluster bacterium]
MGPTASGKTSIAVELVQQAPFEIISVDSAQVYRGLNIGSGKPSADVLAKAPHRLIDIRDPGDAYSAADFRHDVLNEIADIQSNGNTPLLVGGTMLYFKALRDGLAAMPAANEKVRHKILDLANKEGWQAVHNRLAEVDPESAARIHPNDPQRLQRALEVYELTGKSMTTLHKEGNSKQDLPFDLHFIATFPSQRAELHKKISMRFKQMLEQGFVKEVKELYDRGDLNPSLPAIRAVGYRQIWDFLEGTYNHDVMQEKALAATRQLAKRQLTWLRSWPDLQILDNEMSKNVEHCLKIMVSTPK